MLTGGVLSRLTAGVTTLMIPLVAPEKPVAAADTVTDPTWPSMPHHEEARIGFPIRHRHIDECRPRGCRIWRHPRNRRIAARNPDRHASVIRCLAVAPRMDTARPASPPPHTAGYVDPQQPGLGIGAYSVMPGPVTVTSALASVVVTKPGIVAETVVVPAATGSNATPPAATDPPVCAAPTGIVSGR